MGGLSVERNYGIGGWLLIFIIAQCAIMPLIDVYRGYDLLVNGEVGPLFLSKPNPIMLIAGFAVLVLIEVALSTFIAYRLIKKFRPVTVTITIWLIWLYFTIMQSGYLAVWAFSGDLGFFYTIDLIFFVAKNSPLVSAFWLAWAVGWTGYFAMSDRVDRTYGEGEALKEAAETFS
ncbi:MAG: hypothetical protein AAGE05_09955 [Pseudomonadota bacterium]